MHKLGAAITLGALFAIRAFAQTPAPNAAPIRIEGADASNAPFGAFEASVLAGLDRQVSAQANTLAALRAKYSEDNSEVETAKLNLAILQARRDALARKNADIANTRVAVLLDPGLLTRGTSASLNRGAQPAPHEALFDFSKSQTITGTNHATQPREPLLCADRQRVRCADECVSGLCKRFGRERLEPRHRQAR
jgi:hypothetical protein